MLKFWTFCSHVKVGGGMGQMLECLYVAGVQLAAFDMICAQMLQDVQERLVFRTHIYIRQEILNYNPASGDLAYPSKLEMMEVCTQWHFLVLVFNPFIPLWAMGTRILIDTVMRPRSSSRGWSASVTVTAYEPPLGCYYLHWPLCELLYIEHCWEATSRTRAATQDDGHGENFPT